DSKKLYMVQPFVEEAPENDSVSNAKSSGGKTERGGIVTITYTITDTGERKQLFGLTARRIKTLMITEPSPDACQKDKTRMETDGWYVDLAGFSCPLNRPQMPAIAQQAAGGCRDRTRYKSNSGATANLGFPLNVVTTIFDENGKVETTMTTETLELSTATLDAALFDIPKGYSQARSAQDLYKFDPAEMMRQMTGDDDNSNNDNEDNNPATRSNTNNNSVNNSVKKAGTIRIGVLDLSNKSGQTISIENLRSGLIDNLTSGNFEAIAVDSVEDAQSKSCDFVLHADITRLKQSAANKIGGMFSKATGSEMVKEKFEAQIDFKVISVASGQTTVQNKIVQKIEGDAETVARAILSQVAKIIIQLIRAG
ncbi:MAG: hypothetical protein C4324_11475, partial [Blastocatellia bacterium]